MWVYIQLTKWLKHGWLTDEPKKMDDRYNWQENQTTILCASRLDVCNNQNDQQEREREREWLRTLEGVVTQLSRCKIELGAHIPPIVFFYPGVSRVICVATLFRGEATRLRVAPFAPSHPFLALFIYLYTFQTHLYTPLNGSGVLYRMSKESCILFTLYHHSIYPCCCYYM